MALIPSSLEEQIIFFETHLPLWAVAPAAIGLSAGQVTSLSTATTAARAAFSGAEGARMASKNATQNFYNKTGTMTELGTDLIKIIRAFADVQDDPNVYVLSGIPAPQPGQPVPPPGTPTNIRVELLQGGAVKLFWKCPNPPGAPGTVYEVQRLIGAPTGSNVPVILGTVGKREFTDLTLPRGAAGDEAGITYTITAIRSQTRGNPMEFNLKLGANQQQQGKCPFSCNLNPRKRRREETPVR